MLEGERKKNRLWASFGTQKSGPRLEFEIFSSSQFLMYLPRRAKLEDDHGSNTHGKKCPSERFMSPPTTLLPAVGELEAARVLSKLDRAVDQIGGEKRKVNSVAEEITKQVGLETGDRHFKGRRGIWHNEANRLGVMSG